MKSLRRRLSNKFTKPTEPPNSKRISTLVIDPDALQLQGFCHRCTAEHYKYECKHKFASTVTRCREHQHFTIWEAEQNYQPQIVEARGHCPTCLKRIEAEAEFGFFLRARNSRTKAFELDVYKDEKLITAIRPRSLDDELSVERTKTQVALVERQRIRSLSKKDAHDELSAIKARIERLNPPAILPHQT